jgi:solute carrier family 25 oxoglutarate transporter 11
VSLNIAMLVSYDEAKEYLEKKWGKGYKTIITATFISGFFTATFSLPFDNAKTKIQKQKADPITKQLPYNSLVDCF